MNKILILFITQVFFLQSYSVFSQDLEINSPSLNDIISHIEKVEKKPIKEKKDETANINDNRTTVCTKSYHSNLRKGSGIGFPIEYEILIKDYPLKVIKYIDTWYAVEDFEGTVAWVSGINVKTSCGSIVQSFGLTPMYFKPSKESKILLSLERGFIIKNTECISQEWCSVKIRNKTGWIEKKHLWGEI